MRVAAVEPPDDRRLRCGRSKPPRSWHSRSGRAVWEQPRQSLGHRLDQAGVLLAGEVILREQPERRAERRAFGFVSLLTVLRLPADQCAGALGQPEQRATEFLPAGTEIVLLDLCERGALSGVVRVEAATFMPIPTPGGTFDPIGVKDTKIGGEAIELALGGTLPHHWPKR